MIIQQSQNAIAESANQWHIQKATLLETLLLAVFPSTMLLKPIISSHYVRNCCKINDSSNICFGHVVKPLVLEAVFTKMLQNQCKTNGSRNITIGNVVKQMIMTSLCLEILYTIDSSSMAFGNVAKPKKF